ncbi:preprotein translocase subunit SecG [Daejeonella lutea]|uniref:Protein-export membrane protein SecG n=1 Tax=Daejeonella lutea TaxID=572036 RepID=A0A1T5DY12_9SPHI|nr:preprotein translocase subunit SecG [Daejeonella lutea]SKB76486.1 preprotein translocase subunit SecG [Daejeonella lutea]
MLYTIVILAIIVCVLLVLIVLIQNPKGGGLSSGFAGSNNIMGVQRTGDFLEKGTWVLAVSLMVLALMINVVIDKGGADTQDGREIQDMINKPVSTPAPASMPLPTAPAPTPADTTKK